MKEPGFHRQRMSEKYFDQFLKLYDQCFRSAVDSGVMELFKAAEQLHKQVKGTQGRYYSPQTVKRIIETGSWENYCLFKEQVKNRTRDNRNPALDPVEKVVKENDPGPGLIQDLKRVEEALVIQVHENTGQIRLLKEMAYKLCEQLERLNVLLYGRDIEVDESGDLIVTKAA